MLAIEMMMKYMHLFGVLKTEYTFFLYRIHRYLDVS